MLEFMTKLREFSVVNTAWTTSSDVYNRVKSSHSVVDSTLNTTESVLMAAAYIVAPLADQFREPLQHVDMKICQGLDVLTEKVPIVKQNPDQIFVTTREYVEPRLEQFGTAAASTVSHLKRKANDALTTPCGAVAMNSLDVASHFADKAIDFCLPPQEGEEQIHPHGNVYCEDKVYHMVHTMGTLGIKAGRKVCHAIRRHRTGTRNRARSSSSTCSSDLYSTTSNDSSGCETDLDDSTKRHIPVSAIQAADSLEHEILAMPTYSITSSSPLRTTENLEGTNNFSPQGNMIQSSSVPPVNEGTMESVKTLNLLTPQSSDDSKSYASALTQDSYTDDTLELIANERLPTADETLPLKSKDASSSLPQADQDTLKTINENINKMD